MSQDVDVVNKVTRSLQAGEHRPSQITPAVHGTSRAQPYASWRAFSLRKSCIEAVMFLMLAGSVWVNMYNVLDSRMPFGGYKVRHCIDCCVLLPCSVSYRLLLQHLS